MSEQIEKIVDGVTYSSSEVHDQLKGGYNCKDCVGHKDGIICDELSDADCSGQYVFKIKDLTKQQAPTQKASEPNQGVKFDDGKTLYSLVPPYALEAVAKNLTAGLKKYPSRNNWMLVENAKERYLDALMRHLESHRKGEIYDTENIDPTTTHMSAVAVNAMFLLELMLNTELNKGNK